MLPPTPSPPVWGILLAAGRGSRMGRPKPLVPLWGEPLVTYAAAALAAGGHDGLLVVVPPGEVGEGVRSALSEWPFAAVVNPEPQRGLLSSFRAALGALPEGVGAAAFALADMPLVTAETHRALVAAFRETGAPLVLARYGEGSEAVHAPPHLLRADLWPGVLALPDADHGPRAVLRAYAAGAVTVEVSAGQLLDVDTPEALSGAEGRISPPPRPPR
ncbi:nucleotidyltransferase family protein [Deinococcus sp. MIMF12]|uniref:Nucleotidyltransferase family protein n=1 Tax=Deinococcus rhizophilus TaxID=3049544 RepID=A0ABT7JL70_9DEIO|nr:nucleotidyltransferase family protein [Deinococcus rhizophilus]MDL2345792.1 nucleotidyltransferase family protein [Deinococcus rhizophilus]